MFRVKSKWEGEWYDGNHTNNNDIAEQIEISLAWSMTNTSNTNNFTYDCEIYRFIYKDTNISILISILNISLVHYISDHVKSMH